MALINWDDKLSVGVAEMDAQHKQLVDMVNNLHEAMKQGKSHEVMAVIVGDLKGYVKEHFSDEERYMKKINHPGLEAHIKEHTKLIEKVLDYETVVIEGKQVSSVDVRTFLRDWLLNHIQGKDKLYSPNAKGA